MKHNKNANCSRIQQDAMAMIAVELTDGEEVNLYEHLAQCPTCRKEFRFDRKIWSALCAQPALAADGNFERMLSLRLAPEEPSELDVVRVDRVLSELEMQAAAQVEHYDLSTLVSMFVSEMPQ